jgi:general secretion pathway protein E
VNAPEFRPLALADIDRAVVKDVSARVANHYKVLPLGWEKGVLQVAAHPPLAWDTLDELRVVLRQEVAQVPMSPDDIAKGLKALYGVGAETLETLSDDKPRPALPAGDASVNVLEDAQDASVIKIVNQILLEAYHSRATDIHIEPTPEALRVRMRIDGVLYDTHMADNLRHFQAAITSRIKIMAELSIAEKRLPQDGRIKVRVAGQDMDLRLSTLPTPSGESIAIRLLTSRQLLNLTHLGFDDRHLESLESLLKKPHGIIFLTGPTGSGKTTTLYAFLQKINQADKKIITLEDPIEYQMNGITQVQVQPKIGLTFGQGLRSMLRHDPDVMMVGEVRDLETAEIAIRVALTGHLVFSTLHTNDASGAVTRLKDIGVEPYLISSSVLCVIAQRLVRVICPQCKEAVALPTEILEQFGPGASKNPQAFRGKGCEACKHTGFQGRTVIYEILPVTGDVRDLIVAKTPANVIRQKAGAQGMQTLRECGWEKVRRGVTTAEEVLRVTLMEGL